MNFNQPEKLDTSISPEVEGSFDRKSVEFFLGLKERMIEKIGIPDYQELEQILYQLVPVLVNLGRVNKVQQERLKGFFDKLVDKSRAAIREELFTLSGNNPSSIPKESIEDIRKIKTPDLLKWKAIILQHLKILDQRVHAPLSMLRDIEVSPRVKALLLKYGKHSAYELLEPGLDIDLLDLHFFINDVVNSFEFRNRKIKEFVAYRYTRSVPLETDIEVFILNIHSIIKNAKDDNFYRKDFVKSNIDFNAPLSPGFVPYAMERFGQYIEKRAHSGDTVNAEKEALKFYVLFEILHPFADGNGRTGRALFVFLQRYFSDTGLNKDIPLHIPVARYELKAASPMDAEGIEMKKGKPGSLPFEIGTLLRRIIQGESFLKLFQLLPKHRSFHEDGKENVDDFLNRALGLLDSQEMATDLDLLIKAINKESRSDDLTSQDWSMVYDTAKENLAS